MLPEAPSFDSEKTYARKELYEVPSGDQVDGSPRAPVSFEIFLPTSPQRARIPRRALRTS
eukprot:9494358-Pyramimonas_sp.AAC.1